MITIEHSAIPDERLELLFACAHPSLAREAQVALTLRALGGLTSDEIARSFLVSPETMKRRLSRAKAKVRKAGIPFSVPDAHLLPDRLAVVLAVIYLIFNRGYGGSDRLADEAKRLGRALSELMPDEPEVWGLVALMLLHDARRDARIRDGVVVTLAEQDRGLWNEHRIERGRRALDRAISLRGRGQYVLQAAIASLGLDEEIDWRQVALLYAELSALTGSPVVELNRAIAVAELEGPAAGLELIEPLELGDYLYLHTTRAELLARLDRHADASAAFVRALACGPTDEERRHIEARLRELGA